MVVFKKNISQYLKSAFIYILIVQLGYMFQIPVCIKYMLVSIKVNVYSKIDMYCSDNNLFRMSFWLNCNTILAYWLIMSVCPSVRLQLPVPPYVCSLVHPSACQHFFIENNPWIHIQKSIKICNTRDKCLIINDESTCIFSYLK